MTTLLPFSGYAAKSCLSHAHTIYRGLYHDALVEWGMCGLNEAIAATHKLRCNSQAIHSHFGVRIEAQHAALGRCNVDWQALSNQPRSPGDWCRQCNILPVSWTCPRMPRRTTRCNHAAATPTNWHQPEQHSTNSK